MEQGHEETEETVKDWLLSFEKLAGKPVIVSVLIKDQSIEFVTCTSKKWVDGDDAGEESRSVKLPISEGLTSVRSEMDFTSYIR